MTTDLFIRTWHGDAPWLEFCLRSIEKFASGFSGVIVTTNRESHGAIHPIVARYGFSYDIAPDAHEDDYVGQQHTKMNADKWSTADLIAHVDSDCCFLRPFSPDDLTEGGKPVLLKTPYATIDCPWRGLTERHVGFPVEYEYMRRQPLTYPRWIYAAARSHMESVAGAPFDALVAGVQNRELSEFNALGAIADHFYRQNFHWIDTSIDPLPPKLLEQRWSWGGIKDEARAEMEAVLA